MADIFISYKREEQPFAKKLADAIQNKGWTVWWDPEVRAGERFDDVIEKALIESKCVVVLWSKLSVDSQNVKDEATYALNRDKLVPIVIEEVDLPFRFERINTAQLIDWDGSENFPGFQKLIADIVSVLGEPPVEEQKRQREEATPKDEEGRSQVEAEVKLKVDEEEQKRKKAGREVERVRNEEGTLEQGFAKKAKTTVIEKEKDQLIADRTAGKLWLSILLTSIGWAISSAVGLSMGSNFPPGIRYAIQGAIGGLITIFAVRQIEPCIQLKQVLYVSFGWAVGLAIGSNFPPGIDYAFGGATGGLITIFAVRQIEPCIQLKQVLYVSFGWAVGLAIGWAFGGSIGWYIGKVIGLNLDLVIRYAFVGAIGGAIGSGVMFLLLGRVKHSD